MRRLVPAALLATVLLAGGAGCVEVPQPVSPTEPPRPALTVAQAGPLMDHLHDVVAQADRKQDAALAGDVLTGWELEAARGTWRAARQGKDQHFDEAAVDVQSVLSGPAGTYPQQAFVVARYRDKKNADYRSIRHLARKDAGSPWLLDFGVPVKATLVPRLAEPHDGVVALPGPNTTVAGVRLGSMPIALAEAINAPGGRAAKRFTADPFRAADFGRDVRGHRDHVRNTLTMFDRPETASVPTADSGALVLAANRYERTTEADDGSTLRFVDRPVRKRFPGDYDSVIQTGLSASLVLVSPSGRLTLLTSERYLVGIVVNPSQE